SRPVRSPTRSLGRFRRVAATRSSARGRGYGWSCAIALISVSGPPSPSPNRPIPDNCIARNFAGASDEQVRELVVIYSPRLAEGGQPPGKPGLNNRHAVFSGERTMNPIPNCVAEPATEQLLPSGRSVIVKTADGREELEIRSPRGEMEVHVTLTETGPVV